jgi:hypothetical protein
VPQCNVMGEGKLSDDRSRREHLPRCVILRVCKSQRASHGKYAGGTSTTRGIFCRHARCASGGARHFLGKADSVALSASSSGSAIACYTETKRWIHHKRHCPINEKLQTRYYLYTERRLTAASGRVNSSTTTLSCSSGTSCSCDLCHLLLGLATSLNT